MDSILLSLNDLVYKYLEIQNILALEKFIGQHYINIEKHEVVA